MIFGWNYEWIYKRLFSGGHAGRIKEGGQRWAAEAADFIVKTETPAVCRSFKYTVVEQEALEGLAHISHKAALSIVRYLFSGGGTVQNDF